jgi:hypothetical protein
MVKEKLVTAGNMDEIWQQITDELDSSDLGYSFIINYEARKIFLEIDQDPGGGFESGYEYTKLRSRLEDPGEFRFALHHQGLLDEIGKFFGMQDIQTGYPEFDRKVVVKTNDAEKIKSVFAEEHTRKIVKELTNFKFHITHDHLEKGKKDYFLELNIEEAITNMITLRQIFNAFYAVLARIEQDN